MFKVGDKVRFKNVTEWKECCKTMGSGVSYYPWDTVLTVSTRNNTTNTATYVTFPRGEILGIYTSRFELVENNSVSKEDRLVRKIQYLWNKQHYVVSNDCQV